MKSLQLLLAAVATVNAANDLGCELLASGDKCDKYNYLKNGADWGDIPESVVPGNACAAKVPQSPIDLKNSWPTVSNLVDQFSKVYTDQIETPVVGGKGGGIEVVWNGHTSQTSVAKVDQDIQTFYSHSSAVNYKAPQRWNGVQFHFHAGSEHTVEGKRHDLEMHTVHLAHSGHGEVQRYEGYAAAAMGIMFSVKDASRSFEDWETKIIDDFFDSLEWTDSKKNPKVAKVPYG